MDFVGDYLKCHKWSTVKKKLQNISTHVVESMKRDKYVCLTHGYHYQAACKIKESFQCMIHRGRSSREEFVGQCCLLTEVT